MSVKEKIALGITVIAFTVIIVLIGSLFKKANQIKNSPEYLESIKEQEDEPDRKTFNYEVIIDTNKENVEIKLGLLTDSILQMYANMPEGNNEILECLFVYCEDKGYEISTLEHVNEYALSRNDDYTREDFQVPNGELFSIYYNIEDGIGYIGAPPESDE